jgi:hydroxymethylbilane synthase
VNLPKSIIVGSRGSNLAVIQAQSVIQRLERANADVNFELKRITTFGDRHKKASLEELGGEGVFIKELEEALTHGRIDMAVHSAKDMPTELTEGFSLAAVPERIDPRDALVSRSKKLSELEQGSRIGTGSARRALQIQSVREDFKIVPLRGNIESRIKKVTSGELDAVIVAAAALVRIGTQDMIMDYLPAESFTPAVGQGALAIEVRSNDSLANTLTSSINSERDWQSVTAEREFLRCLGGGCRAPIAALGYVNSGKLYLEGMVAQREGRKILRAKIETESNNPLKAGQSLAQKLLDMGAAALLERMRG